MKYDCDARRDRKIARAKERAAACREWHRVFALWPTRVARNDCRWLEFIERKRDGFWYCGYFYSKGYLYRAIKT